MSGIRHVYSLIVDLPDSSDEIANIVGRAAADIISLGVPASKAVSLQTIVPTNNGHGLRPVVKLEENGRA